MMSNNERAKLIVSTIKEKVGYGGEHPVDFVESQLDLVAAQHPFTYEMTLNGRSVRYSAPTADGLIELKEKTAAQIK